jgi:hypothetical protein
MPIHLEADALWLKNVQWLDIIAQLKVRIFLLLQLGKVVEGL